MRNEFNLSHEHKTTVEMGHLIPVQCDEVLPGDTFNQRSTALARVAPLQHPLMHRVELRLHTFYCPTRVLHNELRKAGLAAGDWEDFITQNDPSVVQAVYTTTGTNEGLLDYLGIPPSTGVDCLAYPMAMYNFVYNDFYRDQELQVERTLDDMTIARCAWQKDYFTVARPAPQQGSAESIPIGGVTTIFPQNAVADGLATVNVGSPANTPSGKFVSVTTDATTALQGDLQTGSISIDDLRRSIALQRFAEARMRFGDRYIDYLRYLGVNPTDGRLDRAEYIGGGKETLNFSEVLQTSNLESVGGEGQPGALYGHGIGMGRTNGFSKMFEEHGWLITFLSARPKTVYQNAFPRKFTRFTAMDYWQKELEVLPWQELKEQEVHIDGDANTVFGYVPRYEEYRHGTSHVSSTMRGGTENDWHMARDFTTPPLLNGSFVECTPTQRIYQDANMPDLILNIMHDIKARRLVGATASMGVDL